MCTPGSQKKKKLSKTKIQASAVSCLQNYWSDKPPQLKLALKMNPILMILSRWVLDSFLWPVQSPPQWPVELGLGAELARTFETKNIISPHSCFSGINIWGIVNNHLEQRVSRAHGRSFSGPILMSSFSFFKFLQFTYHNIHLLKNIIHWVSVCWNCPTITPV